MIPKLAWITLLSLFYISTIGWIWSSPSVKKNKEAIRLYSEGKIDEALSKWRDAQIDSPDKNELHYNIGDALHLQKKYKDALNEYEKALDSKDAAIQEKTYYNMGNTSYRMGKLPEAIGYYKKALDVNPDDKDAKYNIEFVRKKIKENLKKQKAQQSQTQQKKEKPQAKGQKQNAQFRQKKSEKAQTSEKKKAAEGKKAQKKKAPGKQKEQSAPKKQGEQEKTKKGEMSKEDALRLLDAVKNDERDLQKELRTRPAKGRYRVEKDW